MNNNPEGLYFQARNDHWTDRGQQLAAEEIGRYITDHAMIQGKLRHLIADIFQLSDTIDDMIDKML